MCISVLTLSNYVEAIKAAFCALLVHYCSQVMPRKFRSQRNACRIKAAVAAEVGPRCCHMKCRRAFILNAVMFEVRALLKDDLNYGIREVRTTRGTVVAFDDGHLAVFFTDYEHPRESSAVGFAGTRDE